MPVAKSARPPARTRNFAVYSNVAGAGGRRPVVFMVTTDTLRDR